MSIAPETPMRQNAPAAVGGLVDAIGGVATAILAICGLVNINPPVMIAAATIVFGVALLLQGGACMAEFTQAARTSGRVVDMEPGGNLAAILLVGAAGVVLGILSLLGIGANVMIPSAVIAFGVAMILGSSLLPQLHAMRQAAQPGLQRRLAGSEIFVSQIASGSAVGQSLAGLAAIVLGILVLAGLNHPALILVALLELGATLVITGGALTAAILGAMQP
ncbi:hypothetical protein WOC76_20115 [Methylocystis sp. IM3]|uniref:hypothetical protein n=1 Tax=unclassified Methylocystis TaxID=2625913 RepID=UPI0030F5DC63